MHNISHELTSSILLVRQCKALNWVLTSDMEPDTENFEALGMLMTEKLAVLDSLLCQAEAAQIRGQ
ncbi:Uncharacterised protein [Serratia quinivorans]|nr:Uncharacterised protein [Serratia quinivorans]CAI2150329.1 Uncharacterised protein [Serratia quinivorans]